jgi:hypothetical protein
MTHIPVANLTFLALIWLYIAGFGATWGPVSWTLVSDRGNKEGNSEVVDPVTEGTYGGTLCADGKREDLGIRRHLGPRLMDSRFRDLPAFHPRKGCLHRCLQ